MAFHEEVLGSEAETNTSSPPVQMQAPHLARKSEWKGPKVTVTQRSSDGITTGVS
jgi:hypothetical protein